MNLIFEKRIQDKYFKPIPSKFLRNDDDIKSITIHGTGSFPGTVAKTVIDWMLLDPITDNPEDPERKKQERYKDGVGLFHALVDRNGDVYNLLDLDVWCYHSDANIGDKYTIGIEMVNPSINNSAIYTEEQYTGLQGYITLLLRQYPGIEEITSHDFNRKRFSNMKPKPCPGSAFNWSKVIEVTDGRQVHII